MALPSLVLHITFLSATTRLSEIKHNILLRERERRGRREEISLLKAHVAVPLHREAFDVVPLIGGVLPLALTAPVHGDLAVALHLELDRAVLAPQARAHDQLLAVTEGVGRHIECGLGDVEGGLFRASQICEG